MFIAIWTIAALLLALWSLVAWGLHGLLTLAVGWSGDVKPLLDQVPYAEWIDRWIPGWQAMAALALDLGQVALGWVGGAATLLAWLTWGLGSGLLLLTAAGLSLFVALVRKLPAPAPAA